MEHTLSLFHLMEPEVLANPYPFYRTLQTRDPVHWDHYLKSWVCTRYTDIVSALHDDRLSANRILSDDQLVALELADIIPLYTTLRRQLLFIDYPDHTRIRGLMNKAFTPRRVEKLRSYIQSLVNQLLDEAQPRNEMDIIENLAYPLPVTVIAELLGLPHADRSQLKKWSDDYAAMLGSFQYVPDQVRMSVQGMTDMTAYFHQIIHRYRQEPGDNLISALIAAHEQDDKLSSDEMITNCILLVAAGHETTTNLIGNGILTLLRHPDKLQKLRQDISLINSAVEEMLRYESPAQYTARKAEEDLEIGGKHIHKGEVVLLIMGAANRDPEYFSHADSFDICRQNNKHLAFGYAAHFCLGASLARMEGQIAIATVIQRFPALRLQDELPTWRENINLRGLASLPVYLT